MGNVIHAGSSNFNEEVINSASPVLVDFWAPWCGPCRAVAPILDKLAEKYEGKAKVVKVNVDEEPSLSSKFRVMSIPTLVLFKDGRIINQMVGLRSVEDLENMIKNAI